MRVVILGAAGQLGSDLRRLLPVAAGGPADEVIGLAHADLDVTDDGAVRATLGRLQPQAVINTTAYHRVDECEGEATRAFAVNAVAVRRLAETCRELGAKLVHVSTDYVFGGRARSPRVETDRPDPQSVYATSKLAGEHLVRGAGGRHFVIRTCGLYGLAGASGKGGNFVETMLRLAREGRPIRVVADQVCTPTSTAELARVIGRLLPTEAYGLYHVTNDGQCSWYEFAERIFTLVDLRPDLAPTTTAAFGARAPRPAYSVLRNARLQALGLDDLSPWPDALRDYLRAKGHLSA